MTGADSFHAILLAGNPDGARHWGDLKRWYHLLTSTYGFTAGEISVLYGDGTWPTGDDAIGAPFPDDPGIPIISATLRNLTRTLKRIGGLMNPNEQFFFWSSDHGGNGAVPTGGNGYGNGACTWGESDDSCEIEMAVALSDAELARITDGSALAFTYVVTSELGPPRFEVWFNASRLELPPPEPGTQRVRLPLPPGVFVQENVITFRASSADAARRVALSAGLGGARVGDARLWFGPRTTQVSLEYSVFLPFVLRDYP
jgi:hypothetical protein